MDCFSDKQAYDKWARQAELLETQVADSLKNIIKGLNGNFFILGEASSQFIVSANKLLNLMLEVPKLPRSNIDKEMSRWVAYYVKGIKNAIEQLKPYFNIREMQPLLVKFYDNGANNLFLLDKRIESINLDTVLDDIVEARKNYQLKK